MFVKKENFIRFLKLCNNYGNMFYPLVIIILFTFLSHGMLLITDFTIYDGWEIEEWTIRQNWDMLLRVHSEGGCPLLAYYRGIFMFFPNPNYAYKVLSFLCFLFSSMFIYYLFRKIAKIRKVEALFIALVGLTFPAFKVSGESSVSQYLFCYCIFLGASILAVISKDLLGWKRVCSRIVALSIFFYSFHTGSLLVFYFGFILSLIIYEGKITFKNFIFSGPRWGVLHLDYLMLPFIYWVWDRILTPANQFYADYNSPSLSFGRTIFGIKSFLFDYLPCSIIDALYLPWAIMDYFCVIPFRSLFIFFILVIFLFYFFRKKQFLILISDPENQQSLKLLLFGFVILFLAIFPYIAVGKPCRVFGWDSRTALLISLPIGVILLSILRFLNNFCLLIFLKNRIPYLIICTIAIWCLIIFSIRFNDSYIHWQALAVKEKSVFHNLKKIDNYSQYTIIEIKNKYCIPETIFYYPVVMWTYQLRSLSPEWNPLAFQTGGAGIAKCFGGEPIGPRNYTQQELNEIIEATTIGYALSDTDTQGKQGILTIDQGTNYSVNELAAKYWYCKFFHPESMDKFLSSVTTLSLNPRGIISLHD